MSFATSDNRPATFVRQIPGMDTGNPNKDELPRIARDWFAELREKRARDDADFDAWLNDHRQRERRRWFWTGPSNWWTTNGTGDPGGGNPTDGAA